MLPTLTALVLVAAVATPGPDSLKSVLKDTLALNAAVVAAKVEPVTVIGDTVCYNAFALTPEDDSSIEDLLQKIPGLEISSGVITLHGKKIERLYLNGKEFFGGSTAAALKNMDANMVRDIKAYSRESDFTRLTGVDDAEEIAVLDIGIKKSFMDGWSGSVSASYALTDRYAARVNANKIKDNSQITVVGGANNFPSRPSLSNVESNVMGSGGAGDRSLWETGVNFSRNTETLRLSGSAHYEGRYSDSQYYNRSQSILAKGGSYYKTYGNSTPLTNNFNAVFKLEWRIDKYTTLIVEPKFKYNSRSSEQAHYFKTTYNADPDTLSCPEPDIPASLNKMRVSTSESFYSSGNSATRCDLSLQLVRRFKKKGRSISFRTGGYYNCSPSWTVDSLYTTYYNSDGTVRRLDKRPYNVNSTHPSGSVYGQLSYTEPLSVHWFLDFIYKLDYRPSYMDRDVSIYGEHNEDMSSQGGVDYFVHNISAAVRYRTRKFNLSIGLCALPQTLSLRYCTDAGESGTHQRFDFNAAPKVYLKYNHSKNMFLKLTYSSWTQTPSVYNLVPVTNGTNPLYVHKGNPDLKPAFVQKLNFEYNFSQTPTQQSLVMMLTGQLYQDKTVNSTVYVPETGARITTPVNVDGNWFAKFSAVYDKTFTGNVFSINANLYCGYRNEISYLYNNVLKTDELSRMGRLQTNARASGRYRKGFLDLSLLLGGQFTDERSFLRPELSQSPWRLDSGLKSAFYLPWGMRIGVDFTFMYQRGYSYDDLNRNYYILDAGISQSFLQKKLVVRIQGSDLLDSQQNIVRSFSADRRSISIFNGPTRYVLLKIVYNFNFKKKQ